MSRYRLTPEDRVRAATEVEADFLTDAEVVCVLDALANGDDPHDYLDEFRFYRSPTGRRQEATDAWESGR